MIIIFIGNAIVNTVSMLKKLVENMLQAIFLFYFFTFSSSTFSLYLEKITIYRVSAISALKPFILYFPQNKIK